MYYKKMLRVRIIGEEKNHVVSQIETYYQLPKDIFAYQFLPQKYEYLFVDEEEEADICIVGCQHTDNSLLRKDEVNLFFTVENLANGRPHYEHLNKFGYFDNDEIDIYIYNHIPHPKYRDGPDIIPKAIPSIYFRMQYFKEIEDKFKTEMNIPFEEKKFCLFISQNIFNPNKVNILQYLQQHYGKVDFITEFPELETETCYHSLKLLKLFNQYKFIICFENSHTPGYITEKIFNIFLARSIPIYDGAPNIGEYINERSFIAYNEYFFKNLELLMHGKLIYEMMIDTPKIDPRYDNQLTNNYLDYYLKSKNKIK